MTSHTTTVTMSLSTVLSPAEQERLVASSKFLLCCACLGEFGPVKWAHAHWKDTVKYVKRQGYVWNAAAGAWQKQNDAALQLRFVEELRKCLIIAIGTRGRLEGGDFWMEHEKLTRMLGLLKGITRVDRIWRKVKEVLAREE